MNRTILYLKKEIDKLLVLVLSHCISFEKQVILSTKKKEMIQAIEKIEKKYDLLIKKIENEK